MFNAPRRMMTAALVATGFVLLGVASPATAASVRGEMGVGAYVVGPSCVISLAGNGSGAASAQCGVAGQAMPARSLPDAPRVLRQAGGEAGPAAAGALITIAY